MAIDPTPPAAPIISILLFTCAFMLIPKRSNRPSHAVIEVSGNAAAAAKSKLLGIFPAIRSSTK
ncbi:hypothetical protein D3C79_1052590 [compost metagenome]